MKSMFAKSIVFLSIVLAMPMMASAQFSVRSIGATTWGGVRAGVSFSNETFNALPDNASTSMTTGGTGGLSLEHWFDNSWAVSVGILYDQKGINELYASNSKNREIGSTIYSGGDNFSMSYLEIPILLKYSLGRGDIRPYICAGPSIGMMFQSSETVSGSIAPLSDPKSNVESTDLSVYAALGLMDQFYHGPILFFEAGYAAGLSKIYKSNPTRYTTEQPPIPFPDPIDPNGVKSGDIRVTIGAMWEL